MDTPEQREPFSIWGVLEMSNETCLLCDRKATHFYMVQQRDYGLVDGTSVCDVHYLEVKEMAHLKKLLLLKKREKDAE